MMIQQRRSVPDGMVSACAFSLAGSSPSEAFTSLMSAAQSCCAFGDDVSQFIARYGGARARMSPLGVSFGLGARSQ